MKEILSGWEISSTTWIYLSSLMTITIFFKFSRFWSVRNLDLVGLIALAPGLLLAAGEGANQALGFLLLFAVGGFFMIRLLIDPQMVRRPLLEPNLSPGGMTFMAAALLLFLMTNVITAVQTENDLLGARRLDQILNRRELPAADTGLATHGPGYPLLHWLASVPNRALIPSDMTVPEEQRHAMLYAATARTTAILSHLAIVIGMVVIGLRHFDNIRTGVAAATLYLVLPYTSQMTGRVDHVLPAALLVWGLAAYRLPLVSGMLVGLSAGAIYYPVFLLPLWAAFYWQRGLLRFLFGVLSTLSLLAASLAFTSSSLEAFQSQLLQMFGWSTILSPDVASGFWASNVSAFRITAAAAFIALAGSFALWPAHKNLGTLLSCSAAVMLGTQFWHPHEGGLYMAWYLPLLLLTIFRPNLEDRVAVATLAEGWLHQLKVSRRQVNRAA